MHRLDRPWLLAFLGGALGGLGHAPFYRIELALAGLALMHWAVRRAPLFRTGWAGGFGYFLVTLNWIVFPFFVDPASTGWMAPFALILMTGGLALFWGAAARLARLWPGPVGLATAFLIAEMLRAYLFTGFPWGQIGHIWLALNIVQLGSLAGAFGLTLLVLLPLALVTAGERTTRLSGLALIVVILAMNLVIAPPEPMKPSGATVRIVQPNFDQSEKWNMDLANDQFTVLGELSVAEPLPDITIWPETAYPWLWVPDDPLWQIMSDRLNGPLVTGVIRVDGPLGWNSIAMITGGGKQHLLYDKHHLVPFGEYIPLPWLLERIGLRRMTAGEGYGYTRGPGPSVVSIPHLGPTLLLICYEAVFPQDLMTPGVRPAVILQVTNDAWFGRFSGPYQHLDQARLRAIEFGLPILRAANSGVSAVIDPYGRVLDSLPLGQRGVLDYPVPGPLPPTLYSRTGDVPMVLLAALLTLILTIRHRKCLTA